MKLLLLCVIVCSSASSVPCSGRNCNPHNYDVPSPYQFNSFGGGAEQNCPGGPNCNQNNGNRLDRVYYSWQTNYDTGCRTQFRHVCSSPVCRRNGNGNTYCVGRKKREVTVEKGAAKSRVKRACWSEAVAQVC